MRRTDRRLIYAFLALLPLAGCGASPSADAGDPGDRDTTGSATGPDRPGTGKGPAGATGLPPGQGGDHAKDPAYTAPARVTLQLGRVGALSKASAIVMRRLVLTVASNAVPADTVRDTAFLDGTAGQTLKRIVKLKPKLSWVLTAKAYDQRDSVIHSGTSALFTAKPGDTSDVSMNVSARYVTYQAVFGSLPATVNANAQGTDRIGVNLDRLTLTIDGRIQADSTAKDGFFLPGQDVALGFDYVTPGIHAVTLEAYGQVGGYQGLLFAGTGTFAANPGEDASKPIALLWAGPDTGVGRFTLILGRIGRVTVAGGFVNQL